MAPSSIATSSQCVTLGCSIRRRCYPRRATGGIVPIAANTGLDGSRTTSTPSLLCRGRPQHHEGHRLRQPEGRRRQDDDHAEPRRRVRREGPPRAVRRHGSPGQPDHVPGHRPRHAREVDVRRARPRHARSARSSASARSTSPARRSTSPAPRSRCRTKIGRERSLEKALRADRGGLRLHLHRHAAEPRAAHDQRPDGRRQGDRPRAVRVSVDARADPAAEHAVR